MSAEQAFALYEAARHRLPPAGVGSDYRCADNLDEIADGYDAFFLDAFGVLNIGDAAIPGAADRVAGLQSRGKRVLVLTNAASVPRAALVGKYSRLGYDFAPEDVISSRDVMLSALRCEPVRHWGVIAEESLQGDDLDWLRPRYLGDDPDQYTEVEGILFLGAGSWTESRQLLLEASLSDNPRPVWVGNPDLVAPRATGFSIEPGFYAHRVANMPDAEVRFFGKPFEDIFTRSFRRLGSDFDPARTIMVGDSLHTDILGARNAGIESALIAGYGFFAGRSVSDAVRMSGIFPDHVLNRP